MYYNCKRADISGVNGASTALPAGQPRASEAGETSLTCSGRSRTNVRRV